MDTVDACPHPKAEKLEEMLRSERETGETAAQLERARRCESCRVMLAIMTQEPTP